MGVPMVGNLAADGVEPPAGAELGVGHPSQGVEHQFFLLWGGHAVLSIDHHGYGTGIAFGDPVQLFLGEPAAMMVGATQGAVLSRQGPPRPRLRFADKN